MLKSVSLFIGLIFSTGLLAHPADSEKSVTAFQKLMGPIFHAEPSKQRMQDTCSKIEELTQLAQKIHSNTVINAVEEVHKTCNNKLEDFDKALDKLHDAFHSATEK